MSFAVIQTGGKQYKVSNGQVLSIEKIDGQKGDKIVFDNVLMLADDDGGKIEVGKPTLAGKKVEAEILEQGRAKKVVIIKFKSKVRYRRKAGHRQQFTKVKIVKV